jgi:hypothetical protein
VSSAGLRSKSDCSGKTQKQLYSKLQTRPLVREGATKLQIRNCLIEISWRKKNWSQVPDGRLTPGQTGRLTVGRELTATVDRLCVLVVRVHSYTTEMYEYCVSCEVRTEFICYVEESRPPLLSSGQSSWLQIQRPRFVQVRFPALPDFLRNSGSGTGSTQPREYNCGPTWKSR